MYVIQTKTQNVLAIHKLPAEAFTCLLNKKKDVLYISVWGAKQILPFKTATQQFLPAISVGDHPNEMLLTKNGQILYQEYKKTKKKYGFFKFHAKRLGVSEEVLSEVSRGLRVDGFYFDGTKD